MEKIQELLNKYMSNNEYISCIEQLKELFEEYEVPINERKTILKKVYEYNTKIYKNEKKKSVEIMKMTTQTIDNSIDTKIEIPNVALEKKKPEPLKIDVTNYVERIKNVV